jgi:hypothetical protein
VGRTDLGFYEDSNTALLGGNEENHRENRNFLSKILSVENNIATTHVAALILLTEGAIKGFISCQCIVIFLYVKDKVLCINSKTEFLLQN